MRSRHGYRLTLTGTDALEPAAPAPAPSPDPGSAAGTGPVMRAPVASDLDPLAELLLAAYRGTLDDEGETIVEAVAEVQSFFEGRLGGRADLGCSRIELDGDRPVSACLVTWWEEEEAPLIAHVVTHPEWQRRGLWRWERPAVRGNWWPRVVSSRR